MKRCRFCDDWMRVSIWWLRGEVAFGSWLCITPVARAIIVDSVAFGCIGYKGCIDCSSHLTKFYVEQAFFHCAFALVAGLDCAGLHLQRSVEAEANQRHPTITQRRVLPLDLVLTRRNCELSERHSVLCPFDLIVWVTVKSSIDCGI
jgi:hypothetical protein